jgi:hypothetical protein
LKAALKLENHARVELNSNNHFASFEKFLGEISSTRTNLKNNVGALDA